MSDRIKVIFDTDIGSDIDDAVALAYLVSQERCELLGVTTVSGQSPMRAEMASAICRNAGQPNVPIHAGCTQAMLTDILQKDVPQARALGNWDRQRNFDDNTALEFMRQTIRTNPGEVTLLATGPMTNVGMLFAMDPELPTLLGGLVLMCGQFFDTMRGEWNAINDPFATAITYGNGCQARPARHVSFGLDVTMKCQLPAAECRGRFTARSLAPVRDFAEVWFNRSPVLTFHDPLAAVCIFEPDICKYVTGKVNVSLAAPTLGWTVLDTRSADKPHQVAREVDSARFFEHYFGSLK